MSGFKDPPKHSQFKPGQSGNPRGRPKGSRNKVKDFYATIYEALETRVRTKDGKWMTHKEILARNVVTKASAGDRQSFKLVLEVIDANPPPEPRIEPSTPEEAARAYQEFIRKCS